MAIIHYPRRDRTGTRPPRPPARPPAPDVEDPPIAERFRLAIAYRACPHLPFTRTFSLSEIQRLAAYSYEGAFIPHRLLLWALEPRKRGALFAVVPAAAPGIPDPSPSFSIRAL